MPLVSVIIPTYNRSTFLRNAIESVLKQTFQDFDLLVVDDASLVDVGQIVSEFRDSRVRWIRHDRNRGEAGARNTGILHSTGEFLAFLDDDDEWLPEKLELQVSVLAIQPPSVGGIYTGFYVVDITDGTILYTKIPSLFGAVAFGKREEENGKKDGSERFDVEEASSRWTLSPRTANGAMDIYGELLRHNVIGTPSTVMLRRSCIERVGLFDPSIVYGVDHDLYLRIARHFTFDCIPKPLVRYHVHDGRMSNDPDVVLHGMKALTRRYGRERGFFVNRKVLGSGYYDAGSACIDRNQRKRARGLFLCSILMNPMEWMSYHQFVCSLFEERRLQALKRLKRRLFPLEADNESNGNRRLPIGRME